MKNLKKGFTRLVILEALAAAIFTVAAALRPSLAANVLEIVTDMDPVGILLILILIAIPLIRILMGIFLTERKEESSDGYEDYEPWAAGSGIRFETGDGTIDQSPFQKEEPAGPPSHEEAPAGGSSFSMSTFIRIQKLSGADEIGTRDRIKILDQSGTYQVLLDSPIPSSQLLFEYHAGKCALLGQEKIPMEPDTPLILYSRNAQGTRIPQYALTFVTYEEDRHA